MSDPAGDWLDRILEAMWDVGSANVSKAFSIKVMKKEILSHMREAERGARVDENEKLFDKFAKYSWGNYNPGRLFDDRISELNGQGEHTE